MGLRRLTNWRGQTALNRAYYANRLLSQTGQGVFLASIVVLAGTGDSIAMGLSSAIIAMMVGSLLFGLLGSALADRLGAGLALVSGIALRTICILCALIIPAEPWALGLLTFVYSSASQLMCPAELALVSVVGRGNPARVHGVLVVLQHVGYGVSVLVAAPLLYLLGGPTAMILGATALYVPAIAVSAFIRNEVAGLPAIAPERQAFQFGATARYFLHRPSAAYAAITLAFAEVSVKALVIALPDYALRDLGLRAPEQYLLALPAGVGALLGLFWAARFFVLSDAQRVLRLALMGTIVSLLALGVLGAAFFGLSEITQADEAMAMASGQQFNILVAIPVALLLGACYAVTPVAARGLLSATAPAGQQARVFGMQATFTDLLCLLPVTLTGLGTELVGPRSTLLAVGLFGAVLLAVVELTRLLRQAPAVTQSHSEVATLTASDV